MCHSIARRARSVLFVSALLALFLTGRCVRYETSTTDITEYPAELLVPLLTGSGSGGGGSGGGTTPGLGGGGGSGGCMTTAGGLSPWLLLILGAALIYRRRRA